MQMHFYFMETSSSNYLYAKIKSDQLIINKCPMCGRVYEEGKYEQFKIQLWGKKEGDYIFSPYCNIVSSKMLELLYNNEIGGFLENDINCTEGRDRKGILLKGNIPVYKELIVTGRCGYLKTRNGMEIPKCSKCGALKRDYLKKEKGFIVDEEWDGSDIFYFKDWKGLIVVTEKVKYLLEKNKMKNVAFANLEEFAFN